jgi:hypothetical protein
MEIYFAIVQRKLLTPNDFVSLDRVAHSRSFEWHYERAAKALGCKLTRAELVTDGEEAKQAHPMSASSRPKQTTKPEERS